VVDVSFVIVVGVFVCNRVFIPDENLVWCPEKLLTAVLAHVHYLPDSWRGQAHTNRVREEFSQLFHYKAVSAAASGFGGLGVACWPLVPKLAGSNPAEVVGFLRAKKSSARLPSEGK
jgi:hypothetical protein